MLRVFCALVFLGLTSCSSNPVAFWLQPWSANIYMIGLQLVLWLSFLVRNVKIFPFMRHPKGADQINKFIFIING